MEQKFRSDLLTLASLYAEANNVTLSWIGQSRLNDNTFFHRISDPRVTFTVRTYSKLMIFFDESWPAGVKWPAEVPRPSALKPAETAKRPRPSAPTTGAVA